MPKDRDAEPLPAVVSQYARLLSLAAHELRTPASVVGGYLRMLQKDTEAPLPDRQRRMIDEAAKSCARLVELIAELSELGQLDHSTAPAHLETFDLFADLEEVARGVHEGKDRQVRLRLSGLPAGARVVGDRRQLTKAFSTILRALLREQPSAVTMVCDRRLATTGETTSALVVISRASDLTRARDAAPQPFNEFRGGVGLGLPIARRVIERAGGRLWAPTPDADEDRALRSAMVISIPLRRAETKGATSEHTEHST